MTSRKPSAKASRSLIDFLKSRYFWTHAALIGGFFLVCIGLTFLWLRIYTHHNQRLDLPDYIGERYEDALEDAKSRSFRMMILDSIHIVGRPPHEILYQDPDPGTQVKQNRTVYVTITKATPDQIPMSRLPVLYGKSFDRKQRELLQSFEIRSRVVGKRYDPGEPDHILAVIYQGDTLIDRRGRDNSAMIEKGATLEFIVSDRSGGRLEIPDLICKTYAEARFLISNSGLVLGEVITDGLTEAVDSAWVSGQVPDPAEGTMLMGQEIRLSLSKNRPIHCQ
ncbi:MAG: PASTA domain-containing protein [Saprospiraceae bacterium]|nr:PASTA domain-containing protein [Saprospiraceae bacterium]